jgi:hypothetical protein
MTKYGNRISFNISIPSEELLNFLRQTITDPKALAAVKKNPRAALAQHGIAIDKSVTDDILSVFCATISKARTYMVKKDLKPGAFEKTFSICRVPGEKRTVRRALGYSSQEYGKNRSRAIHFRPDIEVEPESYWYKTHTTKFPGKMREREPLLHIFTLSKLILELNIAMKKKI